MSGLLDLRQAQQRLLALAPGTDAQVQSITSPISGKRFLAKDIAALRTQPAADLSAMDGYAVTPGPGPWRLVGESRAGKPFDRALKPGECVRISTGAHMPHGSDRVLIQENATVGNGTVAGTQLPEPGRHVRRAGFDFHEGDTILTKGAPLTAPNLALAAAAGHDCLPTFMPPRLALLDSGDELVSPGRPCSRHQIPASNGLMLAAMLRPFVGAVDQLGPVGDDPDALAKALGRAEDVQILVTTGGASVGDHDLIQQALKDWGARIDFWKVAIKPGKPLMVATRDTGTGRQVIVGLPGNPVSSFVTAFLFVLPLVRAAMGAADQIPRPVILHAGEELPPTGKRREFLRAVHDGRLVRRAASQDSSALFALAEANCLLEREPDTGPVKEGDQVAVHLIANG
ncbi:molybdopterin molybdotransferase MoeA [Erythrobacter sp.]|uniref:molybdopterin molybdotransferase MoeA n=1 Tax=Erythrobacter sp. TaxID=1042 RepID=UPI001425E12A|nr:molybdopterin molybdotransferase MoeA [Erythrobacter sp.]QIQ86011.1 MAG: molybdopterin molybdotransferase MoeA [Erythrobacter sp.]